MSEQTTLFRDQPLFDAFEQQVVQAWLPLEISQISAGPYRGHLREIQLNNVSVFFEHQNCMVHKRGIMDEPFCTVSFARQTRGLTRLSEHIPQENSLFFIPSGTEFDVQADSDVETVYFRFNQSHLLERARAMNPRLWENSPDQALIFDVRNRKSLDAFAHQLYLHPLFQAGGEVFDYCESLSSSIMDRVLLTLDSSSANDGIHRDLIARRRARIQVNQAIAYIDAALEKGNCPSIVDICAGINVSQRNLQYSFKKVLGLTPNAYLHRLRLNRVRAQLSRPDNIDVTVTQVATHWHFWHLGRFSNDYLKLFGELPSVTLRRGFI